ncbi:MAG: hypothetical protein FWC87_00025 [Acidimicrobiaceae bacterium]|nr:hypothetical protein [Acidimicrobiaceae bacterium]
MIQVDEGQLDGYLTTWLENKYPHLLNSWFQAKIVTVTSTSQPFTVTLQKLGEPSSDGAEYVVAPSGYFPQVGDAVECCWRDRNTAYVMWPLGQSAAVPAMVMLQNTQLNGTTRIRIPPQGVLPQSFNDFRIVIRAVGPGTGTFSDVSIMFNDDNGSRYAQGWMYATSGNSTSGSGVFNQGGLQPILQLPATTQNMCHGFIDIPYATAPQARLGRVAFGYSYHIEGWSSSSNLSELHRTVWWYSNAPIRTITLQSQALTGSVRAYGIT